MQRQLDFVQLREGPATAIFGNQGRVPGRLDEEELDPSIFIVEQFMREALTICALSTLHMELKFLAFSANPKGLASPEQIEATAHRIKDEVVALGVDRNDPDMKKHIRERIRNANSVVAHERLRIFSGNASGFYTAAQINETTTLIVEQFRAAGEITKKGKLYRHNQAKLDEACRMATQRKKPEPKKTGRSNYRPNPGSRLRKARGPRL